MIDLAVGFFDGDNLAVLFNRPYGMSIDSHNNLYIADSNNNAIRYVNQNNDSPITSTLAGLGSSKFLIYLLSEPRYSNFNIFQILLGILMD